MALSTEFQEFVDEVTGRAHPDEPLRVQVHHSIREGFDLVGLALNAGKNVDELSNEAVAAAQLILAKLNLGTIAKRLASAAMPLVIPALVDQMANYAGTAKEFVDAKVLPELDEVINTLVDVRADLAGVV